MQGIGVSLTRGTVPEEGARPRALGYRGRGAIRVLEASALRSAVASSPCTLRGQPDAGVGTARAVPCQAADEEWRL